MVPHGGLELLRVHEESAVAVDREDRSVGTAELCAERLGEREAEAAEVERGQERARMREGEAIVAVRGRGAGVEGDDRVRRQHAAQFRVHALRLERQRRELRLRREARLTLGAERFRFATPRSPGLAQVVLAEGVQERPARLPGVGLDAERHGIVAADVAAVDVDLDDARLGLDVPIR